MDDHDDGATHVCEACGDTFESEEALERHIQEVGLID